MPTHQCSALRRRSMLLPLLSALLMPPAVAQDRQVRVTIDEGTNVAAALSPDGGTIAIDLQGTLWTLPAGGGEARAITDALGDIRQPAWSPDGNRIAFQSFRDGNWHVWSVGAGGEELRQHTFGPYDDREPHWSPDGSRIVFSSDRSGNYDIWALDVASGGLEQLTQDPANDFTPAWAPDGDQLAFVSNRGSTVGIWVRSGDGFERLVTEAGGAAAAPAWSPDGASLSYNVVSNGRSELYVVGTSRDGPATPRVVSEDGADVFPFRAAWISSSTFLYTADGKIQRGTTSSRRADPIAFTATFEFTRRAYRRNQREFDADTPQPVRGVLAPAASPAGDRIAFVALGDLWLLHVGTARPRQLTDDRFMDLDPAWSNDGSRLAYASDRAGTLDIYVREMATGSERRVTELTGSEVMPVWSPDDSRIAFRTELGLGGDLRIVDLRSGEVRVLRDDLFAPSRPSWSPDGTTLAISTLTRYSTRFREGRNEVLLQPVDGGATTTVTPLPHRGIGTRGYDGPVWSPDGTKWAFVSEGVLWSVDVTPTGAPTAPPRRLTDEAVDAISWSGDSRHVTYQTPRGLRRINLADGQIEGIDLELSWRRHAPEERVVVHAGRIFDGRSGTPFTDMDIVIRQNRIEEVIPHDDDAHRGRVVDAGDQTVMPGLIDMHAHLGYGVGEVLGRTWLAYGVTTIRDPTAHGYAVAERREAVESGVRAGPREFATGQTFDGTRIYYSGALSLDRGPQVALELDRARELQYDLIKTYVRLPDLLQRRVIEFAHANGMPVSSHEVYPAVALGADHVEHLRGTSRRGYSPKITALGRTYDDVVQLVARSGMTITPTMGIQGGFNVALGTDPTLFEDPRIEALFPEALVTQLRRRATAMGRNVAGRRARIEPQGETVRRIVEAGGRVVAGTDAPIIPYGLSLHTELEHYVDAGLSPFQALQTATSVPADALGAGSEFGAIAPGMLADIVVVDGNPLRNIRDARRVRVVIKNGVVYTLEELLGRPLTP